MAYGEACSVRAASHAAGMCTYAHEWQHTHMLAAVTLASSGGRACGHEDRQWLVSLHSWSSSPAHALRLASLHRPCAAVAYGAPTGHPAASWNAASRLLCAPDR